MRKKSKGLTLLELIIVVVIISLGSVLAFRGLRRDTENKEAKQAIDSLRTIAHAVRLYKIDKGSYPTSLANLTSAGYYSNSEVYNPRDRYSSNIFSYLLAPGNPPRVGVQRINIGQARIIWYYLGAQPSGDFITDSQHLYSCTPDLAAIPPKLC